jgi:hypothetical protein
MFDLILRRVLMVAIHLALIALFFTGLTQMRGYIVFAVLALPGWLISRLWRRADSGNPACFLLLFIWKQSGWRFS